MIDLPETEIHPKRYLFVITDNCDQLPVLSPYVVKYLETHVDPDYTTWADKAQYIAVEAFTNPRIGIGAHALGEYFEMLQIPLQWLQLDQGLLFLHNLPEITTVLIWDGIEPSVKDLVDYLTSENKPFESIILEPTELLY